MTTVALALFCVDLWMHKVRCDFTLGSPLIRKHLPLPLARVSPCRHTRFCCMFSAPSIINTKPKISEHVLLSEVRGVLSDTEYTQFLVPYESVPFAMQYCGFSFGILTRKSLSLSLQHATEPRLLVLPSGYTSPAAPPPAAARLCSERTASQLSRLSGRGRASCQVHVGRAYWAGRLDVVHDACVGSQTLVVRQFCGARRLGTGVCEFLPLYACRVHTILGVHTAGGMGTAEAVAVKLHNQGWRRSRGCFFHPVPPRLGSSSRNPTHKVFYRNDLWLVRCDAMRMLLDVWSVKVWVGRGAAGKRPVRLKFQSQTTYAHT